MSCRKHREEQVGLEAQENKMNTKSEVIDAIQNYLKEAGVENPSVVLDNPTHFKMGDYTSNVAMAYAKELQRKPLDLALEIKEFVVAQDIRHIKRIDVIAPGFINFFFDEKYFLEQIKNELTGRNTKIFDGKKFIIEHTQPNPFKTFHIGHLMNNAIGESVKRIVIENGGDVKSCTYHGDVGLHVAKALAYAQKFAIEWEKEFVFGTAYAEGSKKYEEDEDFKKLVLEINKKIYDRSDYEVNTLYSAGRKLALEYFEDLYKRLGSEFHDHFYESESGEIGKKIVTENIDKVFEEGENGAIIFKGENFGLHTRVFLNSEGLPTYEAKEVGLAEIKKEKYDYDTSVTITANEQDAFFKVVECAIGQVFPELNRKLHHLSHGILKLPTGKMSSRTGNIISAESLIDQVKEKVLEKIGDREFSDTEKDEVAEIVAIGAIKYSILRQAIGGDIIFDFDKSLSFEGDSGPYLQYSVVRAKSVLEKVSGAEASLSDIPENWETTNLERLLERFSGVVEKAGREYAPHYLVTYLTELAGEFNSFYADGKIISEEEDSKYKIALTQTFAYVMSKGLDLLGIKVPSKM